MVVGCYGLGNLLKWLVRGEMEEIELGVREGSEGWRRWGRLLVELGGRG